MRIIKSIIALKCLKMKALSVLKRFVIGFCQVSTEAGFHAPAGSHVWPVFWDAGGWSDRSRLQRSGTDLYTPYLPTNITPGLYCKYSKENRHRQTKSTTNKYYFKHIYTVLFVFKSFVFSKFHNNAFIILNFTLFII